MAGLERPLVGGRDAHPRAKVAEKFGVQEGPNHAVTMPRLESGRERTRLRITPNTEEWALRRSLTPRE
eukprot:11587707-Alexandrium_andersonii.AAC.1